MAKFDSLLNDLTTYLKLPSLPVAVKMLRKGEEPPVPAKYPLRDFKKRMVLCQAWTIAKRHEEFVCLKAEDMRCAPSILALGLRPKVPYFTEGRLCIGRYSKTLEAAARSEALVPLFPYGTYEAVLFAPLNLCTFDPDAVFLSGNPAQVMRLVHAALYEQGGRLSYSTDGRLSCADLIVTPIQNPGFYVVMPGHGSRRLAQVKDDEMAFTFTCSAGNVEKLREGLARTHEAGLRYPVRIHLDYEVVFPGQYDELFTAWGDQK